MHRNRRSTIIVAGGALAVASVGYGLGTQADDGTAVAESSDARGGGPALRFERCSPPGFQSLADTLGVESGELRDALADFHEQEHAERHEELAAKLADALGLPAGRVSSALEATHDRRLASELDVTAAELRKAFREIRPDRAELEDGWKEHRQELAQFLAERLGLDVGEVSNALAELPRPVPPPHGGRPGPGGPGAFGVPH